MNQSFGRRQLNLARWSHEGVSTSSEVGMSGDWLLENPAPQLIDTTKLWQETCRLFDIEGNQPNSLPLRPDRI
jgi:hypothetical protein